MPNFHAQFWDDHALFEREVRAVAHLPYRSVPAGRRGALWRAMTERKKSAAHEGNFMIGCLIAGLLAAAIWTVLGLVIYALL